MARQVVCLLASHRHAIPVGGMALAKRDLPSWQPANLLAAQKRLCQRGQQMPRSRAVPVTTRLIAAAAAAAGFALEDHERHVAPRATPE